MDAPSSQTVSMHEVRPGLWLGSMDAALEIAGCNTHRIDHVLSVGLECGWMLRLQGEEQSAAKEGGSRHLVMDGVNRLLIYVQDEPGTDLSAHFETCSKFIDRALTRKGQLLVHCMAGRSRSATVVAAHLMRAEGLTAVEALASVRSARPEINPNPGFVSQLQAYERILQQPDSASRALGAQAQRRSAGKLSVPWWLPGGLTSADEVDGTDSALSAPGTQIVDVRWKFEFRKHHLARARRCPVLPQLASFERRLSALDLSPTALTVVVCEHAVRSPLGVRKLRQMGFSNVRHLRGGMARWTAVPGVPIEYG